ncbi:MAG TPA: ribulose-phosphate 3-epimerase [Dehalococcoidia bacterium]|nr:ribulose-phosphate 3-epimerase [Dehalococcoidia bacterium]HAS28201.1 ribulose-phosphate 3-epimerase [Dehalococcoidia bacterium]
MLKKRIRIVPAILTDNAEALGKMLYLSQLFTDFVQIDIMDGLFVSSKSITVVDISAIKTTLRWEAHLMVNKPEKYIDDFAKAGADQIIFHYEATEIPDKIINMIHNVGLRAGIAVNPDTEIMALDSLVNKLDSVLFMSVIPGFYGSKFIPEVLNKISDFCNKYPNIPVGIDGGIKENNIETVAKSRVSYICVGSAVFCQDNPAESYHRLQNLCNV